MLVLYKRFQTDSPLNHGLLVTQFKYQWPRLEKFLRERGKYRACLCGQKMDVIPLLCPWLGAIEMLFRILFHQAQGQIFLAYLVQKRFRTDLRTLKFTLFPWFFYVCHMDPIRNQGTRSVISNKPLYRYWKKWTSLKYSGLQFPVISFLWSIVY